MLDGTLFIQWQRKGFGKIIKRSGTKDINIRNGMKSLLDSLYYKNQYDILVAIRDNKLTIMQVYVASLSNKLESLLPIDKDYHYNPIRRDRYDKYILEWKSGKRHGLTVHGTVSVPVKEYLREKFNNKCCLCGWSKKNVKTGKVPLIADHIDGNSENNAEENLRLICWNCDSIGPTFGPLNKGNGRGSRGKGKFKWIAAE